VICFAPSLSDSLSFLTLTRLVVVFIFVNFSFALFTPPLGNFHHTTGAVPDPVPDPDYHRQVLGGKQGRNCGSRTTGWPASWVERTMTTSSSATSPCSSPTPPEPGSSICLLRRSPTGMTWSKPSPGTSRAHTCALGTPGISEAAAAAGRIPPGLHPAIFEAAHRAAQHHRLRCHRRVPRWHLS
jgi:hypothetical protein